MIVLLHSSFFFPFLPFFFPLADTSDSLSSSEFSDSEEDRQDDELPPQDTRTQWEVGERRPGSYCTYGYYTLEREQREGEWKPEASKGIVVQKGTRRDYICFFPLKAEFKHLDL